MIADKRGWLAFVTAQLSRADWEMKTQLKHTHTSFEELRRMRGHYLTVHTLLLKTHTPKRMSIMVLHYGLGLQKTTEDWRHSNFWILLTTPRESSDRDRRDLSGVKVGLNYTHAECLMLYSVVPTAMDSLFKRTYTRSTTFSAMLHWKAHWYSYPWASNENKLHDMLGSKLM